MHTDPYRFASLPQDDVERIRQLEQRLRETNGHEVTLIAYENAEAGEESTGK
ncbi:hypothetical protein [Cohnella nanjingensis]|uniref:Uncharacterized protein n=1 Tax=Cohnella nanjingensis TaxID=1387779 RepID=A0A7X0RLW0_9BACL|nr:hypothetical protein [Cohnella nanjingensis]MBB6669860.1 hypothetical protein [Cohnella nanjingensis]